MDVTVVGAGVVGLTTAVVLEGHGHRVQVVAAATGDATTSAAAGAIWFPYRCGPIERVAHWAAETRTWLCELAAYAPEAGVDVLDSYEITATDQPPWWLSAAGAVERVAAPVVGAPLAWHFAAPRVEPARFLPWLEAQLARPIARRTVDDLAAAAGDVVVNCTGLGARTLCRDDALVPLFGQTVIATLGALDRTQSVTDDREAEIFYAIPRRDTVVLGGCSIARDDLQASAAITDRILDHARRLGLAPGATLTTRTGLRPFRPSIRLERLDRIIHNYGHGGAGFTLAYGCAREVARLCAV